MASGYSVNGVGDLDGIFKSRTGAARGNVGISVGGTDIANRYEASAGNGSPDPDQIAFDTNYKYNGTDLRYYFQSSGYIPPTPTPSPTPTPTPTPTGAAPTPTPTPSPTPTVCYNHQLYYGPDGAVNANYTNCSGGADNYFFDTGDSGMWNQPAAVICVLDGTSVTMVDGTETNLFSTC